MKLHLPSVLVSLGVALVVALLSSQSQPATLNPAVLRVEYVPHPRDMLQISDGVTFTVPAGKLFVLTASGSIDGNYSTTLKVNGQREAIMSAPGTGDSWIRPTPSGFTAQPGTLLEVDDGFVQTTFARAWGYLASQ